MVIDPSEVLQIRTLKLVIKNTMQCQTLLPRKQLLVTAIELRSNWLQNYTAPALIQRLLD